MLKIIHLLVDQINLNLGGETDRDSRDGRSSALRDRETPLQGTLPRPAKQEVYLGDTGIYCRQVGKQQVHNETLNVQLMGRERTLEISRASRKLSPN